MQLRLREADGAFSTSGSTSFSLQKYEQGVKLPEKVRELDFARGKRGWALRLWRRSLASSRFKGRTVMIHNVID
jgi:hypothetical protein